MSAGKTYLKCRCPHCGSEVSYPDYAVGGASVCGKCEKTVSLPRAAAGPQPAPVAAKSAPAPIIAPKLSPLPPAAKHAPTGVKRVEISAIRGGDAPPRGSRGSFLRVCLWTLNIAIVLAVVIVVGNHFKHGPPSSPAGENSASPTPSATPSPAPVALTPSPKQATPAASPTPSPPAPSPSPTSVAVTPKGPKLLGDLKITQVALDQPKGAKGSRLVYVTGVMKNDSDHQRFGVRVELDLLDATTNKVGTATDYRQMLEPRATWQFRAIVTDRRAVAAKLAGLKEDE